jgi:hypothetical protein
MGGMANLTAPGAGRTPWFTRNWKWAVPVGCLGLIIISTGFVSTIFLIVESSFRNSDAYTQALARAQANPQVREQMGQPLNPGWFVSGSINIAGPSGKADISIPISGPKRKGTLYVVARKSAGRWTFETLQVEVAEEPERIDLLQADQRVPVEQ